MPPGCSPSDIPGNRPEDVAEEGTVADLVETLLTVREALENYVDVKDGEFGPLPNWAMRLTTKIDAALERAGVEI